MNKLKFVALAAVCGLGFAAQAVTVAKIVETDAEYTTVQAAFDEATAGQIITLITNVTENVMITTAKMNTLDLAGYVLKGANTDAAPVVAINSAGAIITIRDTSANHTGAITTGGAEYLGNGAGINIAAGSLSLYDVTITNCVANGSGGAIYQAEYANLLMSGCTVKGNTAAQSGGGIYKQGACSGSGIIETYYCKSVLHQTEIVGNTAGVSGGGIYFQKTMDLSSCFVAGTHVAMADGTTKAIEDVVEGDVVKTFDHEGGTNSTARVFIWLKEAVATRAFTLAFADGYSVTCVLTHDFLMKDGETSCKYVCLGRANAADYVGKLFYGVDGAWHELLSVTDGEEVNEIYELYTAQHFNSYANGLLTVPADVAANLNLYKLDENLKADATELAADIAKYGYYSYENVAARGVSRAYYDDAGIKYVNVIVGKGLATWEELEKVFASAQSLKSTVSTPTSNVPRLTSLAASKLASANVEPTLDDFAVGVLTLGAGVVVTNNTVNGAKGNIYLVSANSFDSFIQLTASHDGICAGVTCDWGSGIFTTTNNVTSGDTQYFSSDSPAYTVKFETDHLELVNVVTFTPTAVDHTTAMVYVNDEPVKKSGDSYQIESNAIATVVYTAADGYVFSDGKTTATIPITTSTNPATADKPDEPGIQVGDNAYARVANGTCAIFGTGATWAKSEWTGGNPLKSYDAAITNLVVTDGITGLGANSFENMWYLRNVELAASVTAVGDRAFKKCYGLTNVTSLTTESAEVGEYAFSGCHSLNGLSFAGSPTFGTQAYTMQAAIYLTNNDIPVVYAMPTITVAGKSEHIFGKKTLNEDNWTDVTNASDDEKKKYHFFKIEMQ